jgi:hypothetical protein
MWVFAGLCICFGLCMAGFSRIMTPELIASLPPAQAGQLQEQIQRVEEQIHVPFRTALLLGGLKMLIPAFAMGGLAIWVRRGGRVATVVSAVVTGLFLAIVLIQLFLGGGGPQILPALCAFCVPLILLGATLKSLIGAVRNAPQIEMTRSSAPASAPQPGGYAGNWPARTPPAGWQAPTPQWPAATPPNAPEPPTGSSPIRYGYAQAPAPTIPQPPPGDAPVGAAPPDSVPPAPSAVPPDHGTTDGPSHQG